MVADPVECLGAQVEREKYDVGTPDGMIEAIGEVRGEGILAGVTAGPVSAIVPEGDRLGECLVEMQLPGDRHGHLRDLEGMGQAGAGVIVREDEYLGLAGEAAKRGSSVEDAIPVALETCPNGIGRLGDGPVATTDGSGGARGEEQGLERFPLGSHEGLGYPDGRSGVSVGVTRRCGGVWS
ncbi:unannotated protein [freshwater metagenome]|uniref:Unannotated protein n=1 Tax=freshwater metagenome TaxID=449393 RepID=A0A6J6GQX5_9ZZZZ